MPQRPASREITVRCLTGSSRRPTTRSAGRRSSSCVSASSWPGWSVFPCGTTRRNGRRSLHTVASVLTLLLVALLENAGRRAEEAAQEKLNVVAEALAELMSSQSRHDPDLRDAT